MNHDLKKRGVQDAIRINVFDHLEMKEWAAKFKVKLEILKEASIAVVPTISNLREYLHDKHFIVAS